MNTWLAQLDEVELQLLAPILFFCRENQEQAASYLCKDGPISPIASAEEIIDIKKQYYDVLNTRPLKVVWESVKKEMSVLVCSNKEHYAELKHSLEELSRSDTNKIVLTIASAIGNTIGEQAEDITGFCAIVLYFIINGSEASYCADIGQSS